MKLCPHCRADDCPGREGSTSYSNEDFDNCQRHNRHKVNPTIEKMGFDDACRSLAETAIRLYFKQITPVMYIEGFKTAGHFQEIFLTRTETRFATLVILTHVPRNLTVDQLARWFRDSLRQEPILNATISKPRD